MGESIRQPLLLYFFQQSHQMQYRPAFQNIHTLSDIPLVDQVEYLVQLHHRLACCKDRRKDGQITVELLPPPPAEVSPFLFRPPNEPAAAE